MNTGLKHIQIFTPARVCLFGDHQDYLGLPIIAGAINRYLQFDAAINNEDFIEILMPDIESYRVIKVNEEFNNINNEIDFLLAGIRVVSRIGCLPTRGFKVTISGDIPINAGVSSSSALTVGWIHLLLTFFGSRREVNSELIAQLAYEAEVLEHNSPGGKMDQYTIAIGGLLYLETDDRSYYKTYPPQLKGLILAESGIPKETLGTLRNVRTQAQKAIQIVEYNDAEFDLEKCSMGEAKVQATHLPEDLRPFFMAAVENHAITQKAFYEFERESWDIEKIGSLMSEHHCVLRDQLKVSHTSIDKIITEGINAGAYGGKIVGSGGGGCAVVIAEESKRDIIIDAMIKAGAKRAYPISLTEGSSLKKS